MKKLLLTLIIIITSGCSGILTKPQIFYSEAPKHKIVNKRSFSEPVNVVWDRLIKNLSGSSFVITNIRNDSHIIYTTFEMSDNICEYVDAGLIRIATEVTVDYPGIKKEDNVYLYNPCKRNNLIVQDIHPIAHRSYIPTMLDYSRDPHLNGKTIIFLAQRDSETVMLVECSYIFNVKVTGTSSTYNTQGFGPIVTKNLNQPYEANVAFTTYEKGSALRKGYRKIVCSATGNLEKEILDLAN